MTVKKVCPICGVAFRGHVLKVYCGVVCRRRAETWLRLSRKKDFAKRQYKIFLSSLPAPVRKYYESIPFGDEKLTI